MENLWEIVLKASFYGSIVGIIILLTKVALKNKLSGRFHYLIWMILIIKLIVPIGPKSDISIFNKIPVYNSYQQANDNKEVHESIDKNDKTEVVENHNNYENNSLSQQVESNKNFSNNIKDTIKDYIPYIWISGVANVVAVLLFSQYLLHNNIKRSNRISDREFKEVLKICKSKMKVNRDIKVVVNDFINTPSLVGFVNPKILLPITMTNLSNKELEYIILHELAHYKRKDIFFNYLLLILQAIHWFNPVIWYLFKRIREDMELATDEMVLNILKDYEHKEYGMAILTVLERIKSSKFTPGVLGIIEDKNSVKNRIKRIKYMKLNKNKMAMFSIVGIVAIILLGSILLTSAKDNNGEEDLAQILYEHKSPYIGDASNVSNLFGKLPLSKYKYSGMELQTASEPYGIKVTYLFNNKYDISERDIYANSAMLFSLIDNLEYIEYTIKMDYEVNIITNGRKETGEFFNINLDTAGANIESFRKLIEENRLDKLEINSLDSIVSSTLINSEEIMLGGEIVAEGHVILDTKQSGNSTKVYLISSVGTFGFENGVFTIISGYGLVPMVMNITKDEYGNVDNVSVEMAKDGSQYESSVKEMFPEKLHKNVLHEIEKYRKNIEDLQEARAKDYLKEIGRDAEVQAGHVVKEYVDIDAQAENTLLEDKKLVDYPSWLGTRESLVDGIRYIYEKSHYKEDEYDFIVYTKKTEDGRVIEEYKYRIDGANPELIK